MNFLSRFFNKKTQQEDIRVGGMEDFMTLIRVYYQAAMAIHLGIGNLSFLPDLRIFKQTLRVPTVNNKIGVGERNRCKKMLADMYGLEDAFFKEIDGSIKKNCRNVNDIKNYLMMFQGFSQELMMLMGNLMQWKFRMPSIFHKALHNMTAKTIRQILTKNDWSDAGVRRASVNIRKYQATLGYSESWMTEYVYHIVMLAKKEPKPKDDSETKK
ncbi:MAG: hypothetical protein K2N13_04140 [Paraprevotella sp.]|nr:hypothetical protein [Paraprevotella sp.]